MKETHLVACLLFLTLNVDLGFAFGSNQNSEFTFLLPAGATECFFQTARGSMAVQYQVIAGAGLDVGFTLISPGGYRLVSDFRKSDGIHAIEPTEEGDYRICFDNSFSRVSEKMVYVEVIVDAAEQDDEDEDWAGLAEPEDTLEYKLEDIRETMDSMHRNLEQSRHIQAMLRALEARDRYLLEDNLWRVSFWSSVSLLVMVSVALTQVYTLRRLFSDKHRVCT
ncbi:transmembrane emp24 domain-containing protein 1a [Triplophysa rosa]|uniref:Transmembrane emp24 domain-containing protein 1 n=1 Tax=Triplophysa rosa TaxID=992332 RepID=A0A9W7TQ30_TRIRA|nr:transmembrane emp24 domain-containing protein 1a [Triplophysa rosa]KAI7803155.1 transmembrane emp24 domain-containing protein 1 precursor [Triplophysa rosa]